MWPLGTNEINYLHFPLSPLPFCNSGGVAQWGMMCCALSNSKVCSEKQLPRPHGDVMDGWSFVFLSWLIRTLLVRKPMWYRSMNIIAASPRMFSTGHRFSGVLWIHLQTPMYMVLHWFHEKKPVDWLHPYLVRGVTIPPPAYFCTDSSGFSSHTVHMLHE